MTAMKVAFFGAIAMATALAVVLVNALPSVFDVLTVTLWSFGGVYLGRKSIEWF